MTANELRIGNWVTWNGPSHIEKALVSCITKEEIIFSCGDSALIEEIEPIPLTEKWLLKFGFIRHHADYSNEVIYIKNVPDNNEFEWGVYPNELGSGIQIKDRKLLKCVHQLQNLYFALTGEELTYGGNK